MVFLLFTSLETKALFMITFHYFMARRYAVKAITQQPVNINIQKAWLASSNPMIRILELQIMCI